jgi:hypothetical protein
MVLQIILCMIKDESSAYHQDVVDYLKNDGLWILSYLLNLFQYNYGFSINILSFCLNLIEAFDNISNLKGISFAILIFNKEYIKLPSSSERVILVELINNWLYQHPKNLDLFRKNGGVSLIISYILKFAEKEEDEDHEPFIPFFETIRLLVHTDESITEEEIRWLKFLLLECKYFLLEKVISVYLTIMEKSMTFLVW